jgi:adenylate cyclase
MPGRVGLPKSRPALAIAIASLVFAILSIIRLIGLLETREMAVYDRDRRIEAERPGPEPSIALVLIDETDIRRYGHPLQDDTLRSLIETLLAAEPRVVAIDLYRDLPVPAVAGGDQSVDSPAYQRLGETITGDPRVVMIMKFPDSLTDGTPAPRFLEGTGQVGFADLPIDPDGVVRRGLLYLWDQDAPLLSISLQIALRYLAYEDIHPAEDPDDPDSMMLGQVALPPLIADFGPYVAADDAGYQFLLDYRWGSRPLQSIPLSRVLDGDFASELFRDKVVMVGTAAASVKDSFLTPINAGSGGATTYGVEVHAQSVDQLIRFAHGENRPLRAPPWQGTYASIAAFAVLGAVIGLLGRSLWLQVAGLLAISGAISLAGRSMFEAGWWIPVVPPLLAVLIAAAMALAILTVLERAERKQIAGLFSRFQGAAVADEIWRRRSEFMGEGDRPVARTVVLTALMSDLEGYTSASEQMEPEALMSWINEYMSAMAEIVEAHGGVVDDYAGDGVMANFGFPMPSESEEAITADAAAAVRCAVAMGEKMLELNRSWQARGLRSGRCRVGICTGRAVVGCVGAAQSLKYTSVGDTVNTAARLESFDKEQFLSEAPDVVSRVLVSEETWRRSRVDFDIVGLGAHSLKGKQAPVQIYRVMGPASG